MFLAMHFCQLSHLSIYLSLVHVESSDPFIFSISHSLVSLLSFCLSILNYKSVYISIYLTISKSFFLFVLLRVCSWKGKSFRENFAFFAKFRFYLFREKCKIFTNQEVLKFRGKWENFAKNFLKNLDVLRKSIKKTKYSFKFSPNSFC